MSKKKYVFPQDVVKLVRKVEKKILEEPKRFDMSVIAEKHSQEEAISENGLPPCGTVACIAGWIGIIGLERKLKWIGDGWIQEPRQELMTYARNKLGLADSPKPRRGVRCSASELFIVTDWPEKFRTQYTRVRTLKAKANVSVKRLEHLLTTGE